MTEQPPDRTTTAPRLVRTGGPQELADRVAATLIGTLARIQGLGRVPSIVLTGGTIADRIHATISASPDAGLVDWSRVDVWFGDERFVPSDSPDRNAGQAHAALLEALPFDTGRIHVMPASDGPYGDDVDRAAAAYADELAAATTHDGPAFDVLMLGVGPDGHCASLFPGHPEVHSEASVLAVRDSPKPPPTRISLGMQMLSSAREVWFVVSGAEKADAVAAAVRGGDVAEVPAAGPRGVERTVWFLDTDAAWMLE